MTSRSDLDKLLVKCLHQQKGDDTTYVEPKIDHLAFPALDLAEIDIIKGKAFKRVVQKLFEEAYLNKLEDPSALEDARLHDSIKDCIRLRTEKAKSCSSSHIFLTLNPDPTHTLDDIKKYIFKCITKKWIKQYWISFEQRGRTEDTRGTGIHCHILINRGVEPGKARRELKNTFKNLCNVDNPHLLNFKWITEKSLENHIKYITGEKRPKDDKEDMMAQDKLWREKYQLEPYYTHIVTEA